MNVLKLIGLLFVIAVGAALLLPLLGIGLAIVLLFGSALVWLLPILLILLSNRASNLEKLLWILAVVFLSWFAWILYFLLAPLLPARNRATNHWH